jgi:GDP/UDP-N,N'-diacetylbacillosamine 2-epimerase (hydrolysing)
VKSKNNTDIVKICVVTTSRAEYGLLKNFIKKLLKNKKFKLKLIVTGAHVNNQFGNTINEISSDGFKNFYKINILKKNDSELDAIDTVATCLSKISRVLRKIDPNLLCVLGDRYELLGVCYSATLLKIPICHFQGGEATQGVYDDTVRNCITKMAHIHFAATEVYKNRIIQMGENPKFVFNIGGMGAENLKKNKNLSKFELENFLGLNLSKSTCLLTFHPETLSKISIKEQIKPLFKACLKFKNLNIIITSPGADPGYKTILNEIKKFTNRSSKFIFVKSLGSKKYFSILKYLDFLIGNSSSGLLEFPNLKKPTINIGKRQDGRIKALSVIDCNNDEKSIIKAIKKAQSKNFLNQIKKTKNFYYKKNSSLLAIKILEKINLGKIVPKKFYDINILK